MVGCNEVFAEYQHGLWFRRRREGAPSTKDRRNNGEADGWLGSELVMPPWVSSGGSRSSNESSPKGIGRGTAASSGVEGGCAKGENGKVKWRYRQQK